MNLKDRINEDLLAAFKSSSKEVVSALRFLMSVIKNKELEKRTKLSKENKSIEELEKLSELNDDETLNVILGEIKKRKESITQYEKGGRIDLEEKEKKELEIIRKYAPEEMPEEELKAVIRKKIAEIGRVTIKDFGKIMSLVMAEVKGRAGGDMVKKIIEEELKLRNI